MKVSKFVQFHLKPELFCLTISKDWSIDNIEKTGLNGSVYYFSVDYDAIAVDDILGIRNNLMKKNDIV